MELLQKIKMLSEESSKINSIIAPFCHFPEYGAKEEYINYLRDQFSFLSEEYINLLKMYNGFEISFLRFVGSDEGCTPSLRSIINAEMPRIDIFNYFPFALESAGDIYSIGRDGFVYSHDKYDMEGSPLKTPYRFYEFMNEGLLGKYFGELSYIQGNTFYQFLVDQGWA